MRTLVPGLAAHLESGATTLCHCWRLLRRDGITLGFTDHDRDLTFGGTVFSAGTGLEAADATAELGFTVGGGEVSGALRATSLTEGDLARGVYDDASVETWLVNWSDPAERLLLDVHAIGEVKRGEHAFVAELRGLAHRLDEERGRLYRNTCSADLGDAQCGIALDTPAFRISAVVASTDGRLGCSADYVGFTDGFLTGGRLTWDTGANAGGSVEIKVHRFFTPTAEFVLWQPAPQPIAVGDHFTVTAGCDKRFETCRLKFANTVNFRGFPHMPGNDFVVRIPQQGDPGLDGGSLFR